MQQVGGERCGACGFDPSRWRVRDAASLLGALGTWWDLGLAGIGPDALAAPRPPAAWSVLDHGAHVAAVVAAVREGLERAGSDAGTSLPSSHRLAPGSPGPPDAGEVAAGLEREGSALAALATSLPPASWQLVIEVGGTGLRADAVLAEAVHEASHHLMEVGRALADAGLGTPHHSGQVDQVSVSGGGVPKLPVDAADVTWAGVVGDRQRERAHHGRPFQALCLWSSEVVEELAGAGHDLRPGSAGENLTIGGVDWGSLRPGSRLRIGGVLAEVSFPAVPCRKQARWFTDGDFRRIAHERNPRWVRWYAWVREPGAVRRGDPVTVQP